MSAISPANGPTAGGTAVTISGSFVSVSAVNFGATAASFTPVSSTEIDAIAPPGAPGGVDVTVVNDAGTSAISPADRFTYSGPYVTRVTPIYGPAAGGTKVTVVGSGFLHASAVMFGSLSATTFTVNTYGTSITAYSPASDPGTVDVTVVTPVGTSPPVAADHFMYQPIAVTKVKPASGPMAGGTTVFVTGTSLSGATAVMFGSTPAASFTPISSTALTAVSPPTSTAGPVDITVTAPGGTSVTTPVDTFTYLAPMVTRLTPHGGPIGGGTSVTITGRFLGDATAVLFGTTSASSFQVLSASTITAVSPPGVPGTVDVSVTTPYTTTALTLADHFTYKLPSVARLSPTNGSGVGGVSVTITGANFTGATQVLFGSTPAESFTVVSPTQITATSPQAPIGASFVTVVTPYGASTATSATKYSATAMGCPVPVGGNWTGQFTWAGSPPPASSGTWGGPLTFKATKIVGVWAITGTIEANGSPVGAITSGQVSCNTWTLQSGPWVMDGTLAQNGLSMTTAGNDGSNVSSSALVTPTVTAISPATGPGSGGTSVTISGYSLGDVSSVTFGGTAGTITASSNTSLTVTSPAGAGSVDVTVTSTDSSGDTATSATSPADVFAYTANTSVVTSISPNSGPRGGGTTITITGSGFTGATAVNFGGIPAASFIVNSDTSITAVSNGADIYSGNAPGSGDVTVTTAAGTSATSPADVFTWVNPVWPSSINVTATYQGNPNPGLYEWDDAWTYNYTLVPDPANCSPTSGNCVFVLQEGSLTGVYQAYTGGLYCIPVGHTVGPPYTADHSDSATLNINLNGQVRDGTYQFYGDSFVDTEGPYPTVPSGCPSGDATNMAEHSNINFTNNPPRWTPNMAQLVETIPPISGDPADQGGSITYNFNYANVASVPTVAGVSPNSGPAAGGGSVTITGAGFTGAEDLWFCGPFTGGCYSTVYTVDSDTEITAVVPSALNGPGPIDVAVTGPFGTSLTSPGDVYTYTT